MKHEVIPPPRVSRETWERLDLLAALVVQWADTLNLVSRADLTKLRQRHIEDSLQMLPLLPSSARGSVDLGSGAGFPGLVLSIASGQQFHLVEADRRKAAFLREAARICRADVLVHTTRIEATLLPSVNLITARALAPLRQLLEWCAPKLHPDGMCLFPKGTGAEKEVAAAAAEWSFTVRRWQSRTDPLACVLQINDISARE